MTDNPEKQEQILHPSTKDNKIKTGSIPMKVLAIIFTILFVIVAAVGVVGYDIWRVLFNPPLVKQVLTDEIVNSDIVPAMLEAFSENRAQQRIEKGEALSGVTEPDIVLLLSYLDAGKWREIKDIMLTDEFVTHLVSVSIDGLYAWIDSADTWPKIAWDMSILKTRLVGKQGEQAILIAYGAMPECTQKEVDDFTTRLAAVPPGVEVLYNLCQFPDPWHEDQLGDYTNALIDVNQNIPKQYDLSRMLASGQNAGHSNPEALKIQLRALRQLAQLSWLAALILLAIIIILVVRTLRSLGKYVGIPLVITGLIVLLAGILGKSAIAGFVTGNLLANTSPFLRQEVSSSLGHLMDHIFQPMQLQGGIILVVGVLLIILGFTIKNHKVAKKS